MKISILCLKRLNPDNPGHPILRAHLNALVMWIWIGVWIMLIGAVLAPDSECACLRHKYRCRSLTLRTRACQARGHRRLTFMLMTHAANNVTAPAIGRGLRPIPGTL